MKSGLQLVVTDPLVGEFAIDGEFQIEMLDLVIPQTSRENLPNGAWRKIPAWIFAWLLRGGVVSVAPCDCPS